jgi:hypothetical protein
MPHHDSSNAADAFWAPEWDRLAECSHPGAGERERHPAMGPRGGAAGYGKRTAQTACRYLRILRQAALLAPLPARQGTH